MESDEKNDDDVHSVNSVAITTCLFIFMTGILISNGFVVGILSKGKSLRTPPNFYIIALSVSQMLVGTFVVISTISVLHIIDPSLTWCTHAPFFELFAFCSGIFFLIALTVDRFRSVLFPLSYKPTNRKTFVIIGLLTVSALVYSTKIYIQFAIWKINNDKTENDTTTEQESTFCNILTEDESSDLWFRLVDFVMLFVAPVISMAYMYIRIVQKLWVKGAIATSSTMKKRRATVLSLVCVSSFLICWLPFYLIDIVHDTIEIVTQNEVHGQGYDIARYTTIFLALSNSIITPVVYGFLSKKFQQELWILKNQMCCKYNKVDILHVRESGRVNIENFKMKCSVKQYQKHGGNQQNAQSSNTAYVFDTSNLTNISQDCNQSL